MLKIFIVFVPRKMEKPLWRNTKGKECCYVCTVCIQRASKDNEKRDMEVSVKACAIKCCVRPVYKTSERIKRILRNILFNIFILIWDTVPCSTGSISAAPLKSNFRGHH